MNKSFDDALLSSEEILKLEFESKLEFALNFKDLYIIPLQEAIALLPAKKSLAAIKHIGHKVSGHAEFPDLIPLGESLEQLALEMLEKSFSDSSVYKKIHLEILKVYESDIVPFINQNKK